VAAVAAWREAAGIVSGALFRSVDRHGRVGAALSARAVALVVKRYAKAAGLEAAAFAGHSARSGFVTSALGTGQARAGRTD
jgi:hypothetical protein